MSDAAVAVANTSDAFAHRSAEGPGLAFICEPWFEWTLAGNGFWRCTFTGYGATHGRGFVASKVFHTAAVVGGVTSGSGETKVGSWLTHEQFTVRSWRAFLSIATGRYEVCSDDAPSSKRVTALTESAV